MALATLAGLVGGSAWAMLMIGLGLIAVCDPVRYVRLQNRVFGEPEDWFPGARGGWLKYHDPEAARRSATMRIEYRLMGVVLVFFGAVLIALLTSSAG